MTIKDKDTAADMMRSFENLPEKSQGYVKGLIDGLTAAEHPQTTEDKKEEGSK